ncbi:asparaginase [Thalassobius sp. S69A]|uniref:asparaginase n=1 Tax=unclassified Thalassovita TaxID=2619711 RepID=UPI000C0E3ABF|nr:L-asparaginase [Paracoccaceae bacterium]MBT25288.1 L-asparaginase [Paracoccaceae bacterium]
MGNPVPLAEIWRGPFLESVHLGHAVIVDDSGQIVQAWGDPTAVVLPRSSSKMVQGLPLIESGAADAFGLTQEHLALACASHNGAPIHTGRVQAWLAQLGLSDDDFRCGPQDPGDQDTHQALIRAGQTPCQYHNNCSGKHAGFLTLNQHIGGGAEYVEPDHPIQKSIKDAFQDVTGEDSPGFGIDGCSAPNFATTLMGMGRAMAVFAKAQEGQGTRASAAARLRDAMIAYPELVAGEGRACTELMRAAGGRVALKTGAEAFFAGIVPEKGWGIALKIMDGSTRGAECAIASILVKYGLLEADHPATLKRRNAVLRNWRGIETGMLRPAAGLI